jgi:hypothetical protein
MRSGKIWVDSKTSSEHSTAGGRIDGEVKAMYEYVVFEGSTRLGKVKCQHELTVKDAIQHHGRVLQIGDVRGKAGNHQSLTVHETIDTAYEECEWDEA